jgi:hypothetical protein
MRLPLSRKIRLTLAVGLVTAGLALDVGSASACGPADGYTYAGVAARSPAYGVSATVTPLHGFKVLVGHVAGWVGVGGPGLGPNGTDEWLQIGFSGFPAPTGNDLYYELVLPGRQPAYHQLAANVPSGQAAQLAVLEMSGRPDYWRVWLNGKPVSQPIYMPASHGRWAPIATAESWDGGAGGACNGFLYSFEKVSIAQTPGGGWRQLVDSYAITNATTRLQQARAGGSFLAAQGPAAFRAVASLTS